MEGNKIEEIEERRVWSVCAICNLEYENDVRIIPECLHSFCFKCLAKSFETSHMCPQCSTPSSTPLHSLPPNYSIQTWLSLSKLTFNEREQKLANFIAKLCEECEITNGEVYCKDCNRYYCLRCSKEVHLHKIMKKHIIGVISKLQYRTLNPSFFVDFYKCETHNNEDKRLFCEKCKDFICVYCLDFGEFHSEHNTISVFRFIDLVKEKWSENVQREVDEIHAKFPPKNKVEKLNFKLEKIEEEIENLQNRLNELNHKKEIYQMKKDKIRNFLFHFEVTNRFLKSFLHLPLPLPLSSYSSLNNDDQSDQSDRIFDQFDHVDQLVDVDQNFDQNYDPLHFDHADDQNKINHDQNNINNNNDQNIILNNESNNKNNYNNNRKINNKINNKKKKKEGKGGEKKRRINCFFERENLRKIFEQIPSFPPHFYHQNNIYNNNNNQNNNSDQEKNNKNDQKQIKKPPKKQLTKHEIEERNKLILTNKISANKNLKLSFGSEGRGDYQFQKVHYLTLNSSARLIGVSDVSNHSIQIFSYDDGTLLSHFSSYFVPDNYNNNNNNNNINNNIINCDNSLQLNNNKNNNDNNSSDKNDIQNENKCNLVNNNNLNENIINNNSNYNNKSRKEKGMKGPSGIIIFDKEKMIAVADQREHQILMIDLVTRELKYSIGRGGKGENFDQLNQPRGICAIKKFDLISVCDCNNKRISFFSISTGKFRFTISLSFRPYSLDISNQKKLILITDYDHHLIHFYSFTVDDQMNFFFREVKQIGDRNLTTNPRGISIHPKGNFFVVATRNDLLFFTLSGDFICRFTPSPLGNSRPLAVCVDRNDHLIAVSDFLTCRVSLFLSPFFSS